MAALTLGDPCFCVHTQLVQGIVHTARAASVKRGVGGRRSSWLDALGYIVLEDRRLGRPPTYLRRGSQKSESVPSDTDSGGLRGQQHVPDGVHPQRPTHFHPRSAYAVQHSASRAGWSHTSLAPQLAIWHHERCYITCYITPCQWLYITPWLYSGYMLYTEWYNIAG